MLPRPIRHRRARRTDFTAIWEMLLASGGALPGEPDRATLRRFRRLVADLGADLYVAEADGEALGVVHVAYVRRLAGAADAYLELLLVGREDARGDVAAGLAAFAIARARRRGCGQIRCVATHMPAATAALERLGWRRVDEAYAFDLTDAAP